MVHIVLLSNQKPMFWKLFLCDSIIPLSSFIKILQWLHKWGAKSIFGDLDRHFIRLYRLASRSDGSGDFCTLTEAFWCLFKQNLTISVPLLADLPRKQTNQHKLCFNIFILKIIIVVYVCAYVPQHASGGRGWSSGVCSLFPPLHGFWVCTHVVRPHKQTHFPAEPCSQPHKFVLLIFLLLLINQQLITLYLLC